MPTNPTGRDIYTRGGVLDQVAALAWDQHRVEAGLPTFPRDTMTAEFLTQDEDVCDGFRSKVLPFVLRTLQAEDARAAEAHPLTYRIEGVPRSPGFETMLQERVARMKQATDQRIRAALEERGINADIVAEIARRAQAGEFVPPVGEE